MVWKRSKQTIYRKSQVILAILLVLLLVTVGSIFWLVRKHLDGTESTDPITTNQVIISQDTVEPVIEEAKPEFDSVALQKAVDDWAATLSGQASVVLADKDANILASNNPEQAYFTASIYKLYTAYFGYQAVDAKTVNPTEVYVNGHTRAECLDLMIRESDSPCAEKLWNELDKQSQTEKLVAIGIKNTSMEGLSTTAEDAAIMLAFIVRGEALSSESRAAFLQSMKTQIFRDSLNVGFSDALTVYNKIGFNGLKEYHDTAIVEFSDGRQLIVSVLTENVGTKAIANLGRAIEAAVYAN
jgi:beta-lactamase class A